MIQTFAKSEIGYSHIKEKKPLQDFSSSYSDPLKKIITCCDGHGGKKYVRSNKGSMFASFACINVLNKISYGYFQKYDNNGLENLIRLNILCEWNKLVENSLKENHLSKKEMAELDENETASLKKNPAKAYGTTLSAAMLIKNKLIVVKIGDGEALLVKNGELEKVFSDDDEPAANQTNSMCQEDAFEHLKVRILDFKGYDGILLCTDGMSSPYQSYENFKTNFIRPLFHKVIEEGDLNYINNYVKLVAREIGVGDDVSLAFFIDDTAFKKYYR